VRPCAVWLRHPGTVEQTKGVDRWRKQQGGVATTVSLRTEFFDELGRRGHEPLLRRVTATIGFEVTDEAQTEHRLVVIDRGEVRVAVDEAAADATLSCSPAEFDDLVTGRTSPMASLLRGALTLDGDPELLVLAQRLFSSRPVEESARLSDRGGQGSS
jgi:putative sterol carrier protein